MYPSGKKRAAVQPLSEVAGLPGWCQYGVTPESLVVNALLAIRVESSMEGGRAAYTKSEIMARKPVVWLGDSLGKVRGFALEARRLRRSDLCAARLQKKSRKTPRLDVELAKQRYRTLIRDRKQ